MQFIMNHHTGGVFFRHGKNRGLRKGRHQRLFPLVSFLLCIFSNNSFFVFCFFYGGAQHHQEARHACGEVISLCALAAAEAVPTVTPLIFRWSQVHANPFRAPPACANNPPCEKASFRWLFVPFPPARCFFYTSPGSPAGCSWSGAHSCGGQGSCRSCKTPVSEGESCRAKLSVWCHQPMAELVVLAVLPHGFVIFFCVSGAPRETRFYNW